MVPPPKMPSAAGGGPFPPYPKAVAHTKGLEPQWLMVWSLGSAGRAGQGAQGPAPCGGSPVGGGIGVQVSGDLCRAGRRGDTDTHSRATKDETCLAMGDPGICRERQGIPPSLLEPGSKAKIWGGLQNSTTFFSPFLQVLGSLGDARCTRLVPAI